MAIDTLMIPGIGTWDLRTIPAGETLFLSASEQMQNEGGYYGAIPPGTRKWRISYAYHVSATLVTRRLYAAIMGNEPWRNRSAKSAYPNHPDAPANYVSYRDASTFCERLASCVGQRIELLSELEYERMASGGIHSDFYWYEGPWDARCEEIGKETAMFMPVKAQFPRWQSDAATVARLRPNQFGVYDAIGLIREWVRDTYGYGEGPLVQETFDLPREATDVVFNGGPLRVCKGGSYGGNLSVQGRWTRIVREENDPEDFVGFRFKVIS